MIDFLRKLIFHDFWLKLLSLTLAVLIWLTVSFAIQKEVSPAAALAGVNTEEMIFSNVPVSVIASEPGVRSVKVNPGSVQITVRGEANKLQRLETTEIHALVDLTGIESARGMRQRVLVTTPPDITLIKASPSEVEIIVPPTP